MQLTPISDSDIYRLIHGLFHIALVISSRAEDKGNMKKAMYHLFITYFARADNMLLPRRQITHYKLCFYYICKFGVISIKYVIILFIEDMQIFPLIFTNNNIYILGKNAWYKHSIVEFYESGWLLFNAEMGFFKIFIMERTSWHDGCH